MITVMLYLRWFTDTIAGWNTTLALKPHAGTIPSYPSLGKALSALELKFPTPRLSTPGPSNPPDNGDDHRSPGAHLIQNAIVRFPFSPFSPYYSHANQLSS